MGVSFSASALKLKLNVAVKRLGLQMNKLQNSLNVERREIAVLLSTRKDESARIRVRESGARAHSWVGRVAC
jgi:hypothetical protein